MDIVFKKLLFKQEIVSIFTLTCQNKPKSGQKKFLFSSHLNWPSRMEKRQTLRSVLMHIQQQINKTFIFLSNPINLEMEQAPTTASVKWGFKTGLQWRNSRFHPLYSLFIVFALKPMQETFKESKVYIAFSQMWNIILHVNHSLDLLFLQECNYVLSNKTWKDPTSFKTQCVLLRQQERNSKQLENANIPTRVNHRQEDRLFRQKKKKKHRKRNTGLELVILFLTWTLFFY